MRVYHHIWWSVPNVTTIEIYKTYLSEDVIFPPFTKELSSRSQAIVQHSPPRRSPTPTFTNPFVKCDVHHPRRSSPLTSTTSHIHHPWHSPPPFWNAMFTTPWHASPPFVSWDIHHKRPMTNFSLKYLSLVSLLWVKSPRRYKEKEILTLTMLFGLLEDLGLRQLDWKED